MMDFITRWKHYFSMSPINYLSLGFKDNALNNKFQHQARVATYERAKAYIAQLGLIACFSFLALLIGWHPFAMLFSMLMVTMLSISLCLLAAKWRLCVVDFIPACTTLMRGLPVYYMIKLLEHEKCMNYLSNLFFKNLAPLFFFADLIIFRTNIIISFLIAVPIFFAYCVR